MKVKEDKKIFFLVVLINFFVFIFVNLLFNIKYEQVDDFIMYTLYSGLDGSTGFYAIFMHPFISMVIGAFYKILPMINWHTIFLLSMQFICFTLIGNTILKKNHSNISIILYTLFASIFYTALLLLIQFTSVAALLIMTAFFLLIDIIETNQCNKFKLFTIFILYIIGIMTRIQSLLIIVPFYAVYLIIYLVKYKNKLIEKQKLVKLIKYYMVMLIITIIVYLSNLIIYNSNPIYKEYNEWNKARSIIQDIVYINYDDNKEIYDEVGWSKNDFFLFRSFGFGDENIFSKDNLQKILELKNDKGGDYGLNLDLTNIVETLYYSLIKNLTYIYIIFVAVFILNIYRKSKIKENTLIFLTVLLVNSIFIILNRNLLRVAIPEYIIGTLLLIYNLNLEKDNKLNNNFANIMIIVVFIIFTTCSISGQKYDYGYRLKSYENYRQIIDYTNNNKDNVYLYTIPSLQDRYLSYSVYQMPPNESFSNLKQIGRMGYVYAELL